MIPILPSQPIRREKTCLIFSWPLVYQENFTSSTSDGLKIKRCMSDKGKCPSGFVTVEIGLVVVETNVVLVVDVVVVVVVVLIIVVVVLVVVLLVVVLVVVVLVIVVGVVVVKTVPHS